MVARLTRRKAAAKASLAAAALLLALSGCARHGAQSHAAVPADPAVARVNGETLYASDVDREALAEGLVDRGQRLDPASAQFRQVLRNLEDARLLAQEAERQGLDRSAEGVRALAAARDRVLADLMLERTLAGAASEAAVRGVWTEMVRDTPPAEEIAIRRIVVASRAEAQDVKAELAKGADFAALAGARSTDPATRLTGGVLAPMTLADAPGAYAAALKTAKAGQIVGPFQTAAGWVVARVDARGPKAAPSLEEARPQIVRFLTYDKVKDLVLTLRRKGRVVDLLPPAKTAAAANAAPTGLKGEAP